MLSASAQLLRFLGKYEFATIRKAFVARAMEEHERTDKVKKTLERDRFYKIEASTGDQLLDDGRPIIWVGRTAYAMPYEDHLSLKRKVESDAIKNKPVKNIEGTEKDSLQSCPSCRETLKYSVVCPACPAGQAGYRHRYVCACGVDFVTKERL